MKVGIKFKGAIIFTKRGLNVCGGDQIIVVVFFVCSFWGVGQSREPVGRSGKIIHS